MTTRYSLAIDLAADAEALVRAAEQDLADQGDATMVDVYGTRLDEAYALQDEVLEAVAPAIERRRREVAEAGWRAIRAARGDPAACWSDKYRRWMAPATKAWLIGRLGRRAYLALPWALVLVVLQGGNF